MHIPDTIKMLEDQRQQVLEALFRVVAETEAAVAELDATIKQLKGELAVELISATEPDPIDQLEVDIRTLGDQFIRAIEPLDYEDEDWSVTQ